MTPTKLKAYWKAIAGLIGPAVVLLVVDLPGGVTSSEWAHIAAAAVGGGGLVALFPSNKKGARR